MAVHEPTAWIVGLEGDDNVSFVEGHDDVSSRRIVAAEIFVIGACTLDIAWAVALVGLVDDGKIMTVEMNLGIGERLRGPE